jgi:methylmalonyl-CoA mutase C-terminal domain/subunit
MASNRPLRIVLAKVGLDGHDRGIRVIATACKDAGFEVVYGGLRHTPETLVEVALQEDVDAIGVSLLSAAHMTVFPRILELLKEQGLEQRVLLTGGGVMSERDIAALMALGVGQLFVPGTPLERITAYIRTEVERRRTEAGEA